MSEGDLTIHVCTACRRARADLPEGFDQPGLALAERLAAQLAAKGSTIPVLPVECLCVCKRPCTIALSADGSKLYVALSNWNYIVVYDTAAGVLATPIYCPSGISGLAMSPDGTTLYGAARFNAEVYKVDVASDTVVDTWSVGIDIEGSAHPMTVSPDGGRLYVGRASSEVPPEADAFVITVDTGDGSELAWTTLAGTPASLAVEPEGRFVYAAIPGADSVQVVDTTTSEVDRTIGGFHSPAAIAPPVEPIMDGLFGSGFD